MLSEPRLGGFRAAIVGVGALGSMLATAMSRLGLRHLLLVDSETLEPGNLIRHECLPFHVENSKVAAVGTLVGPLFERQSIESMSRDVIVHWDEVQARLLECNVVIDATGDPGVHELLGRSPEIQRCGLVWAYVKPGPQFGLLVLRSPASGLTLSNAETALAEKTDRWDEFASSDATGLVWPEPGCYHPTFRAPYHRMRMMADGFLAALLDWVRGGMKNDQAILFEQRPASLGLELRELCHIALS